MTIVVKKTDQDAIFIPADLMKALNLREGDTVKAIVSGKTLRLAQITKFLELRGALADDASFDDAIEFIDQAFEKWKPSLSA